MHWHERRFQNKDGSLTAAGRIRYGVSKAGSGLAKLAKGAGSLSIKAGTAIGNNVKAAAAKAKGDIHAKKVQKLTATKSDLAKNYDKLTPEERQAALAKFKFQDDLKDSMKKDWDRAVNYAKLTFDAIDTAKKIGDDISTIATGKNLGELAKAKANEGKKDKEYWQTEQERLKAEKAEQDLIAQKAKWKYANENPDNKYGSKYKEIKKQDEKEAKQKEADDKVAKEKADAEAQEKNVQRMQRLANTVDAITSAPGNIKNAASAAKEKYNDAADKFNDRVNKAYDAASNAAEKGKAAAGKVKDVAADAYNYTGEAVGKAGTKVYNAVERSKGAAADAYNYSGEAVGKAGTKVYNAANKAGAKIKEAAAAAKEKNRQAEASAARLTKAKAEALYKKAGSMAEAAKKAGCSPSTIRNFLGNVGKTKSKTGMSMKIKIVSPEEYNAKNKSNNPDDYTRDRIQKNQEMIDHGMEILDDILRHSDIDAVVMTEEEYLTFSEDDVASLFHGATFFV
jgi:hypothetical protein